MNCSADDITYEYNGADKSLDVSLGDRELTDAEETAIAAALTEAMASYKIRK